MKPRNQFFLSTAAAACQFFLVLSSQWKWEAVLWAVALVLSLASSLMAYLEWVDEKEPE